MPSSRAERRNALLIAVTAARECDAADDAVLHFDLDLPRAGSLAGVGYFTYHKLSV